MSTTENDLSAFNDFVRKQISDGSTPSIDELFDAWRLKCPPEGDLLAIKASLADLDNGERGEDVESFNRRMVEKYRLS